MSWQFLLLVLLSVIAVYLVKIGLRLDSILHELKWLEEIHRRAGAIRDNQQQTNHLLELIKGGWR
jgi:hypothetical protein